MPLTLSRGFAWLWMEEGFGFSVWSGTVAL